MPYVEEIPETEDVAYFERTYGRVSSHQTLENGDLLILVRDTVPNSRLEAYLATPGSLADPRHEYSHLTVHEEGAATVYIRTFQVSKAMLNDLQGRV